MSKDMVDMVKAIGESKTKQEEDRIMTREISLLKEKMGASNVTQKRMREYIIRMIYCEMLGHDASFAHNYAVKFTAQSKLIDKRIAYLGVCLCLQPEDELIFLMINTMQRDLKSQNFLEVCTALHACSSLVNEETIPAMLKFVTDLLPHQSEYVRKKAVMALHSFYLKAPHTISHLADRFRHTLCDINPSVMACSLHIIGDMVKAEPSQFKDLVPSLVNILKQIIDHRLHRDYDYHRLPAPWMQIRMLNVLALLGANDQSASENMYEILFEVMKRADVSINIGYAVIYECVRTITSIYPNSALLETAAANISRFLTSASHNLKYLGITSLAAIVQIDAKYATPHQLTVIDCLEDHDDTLRRKTLDLLFRMTNVHNVSIIVEKMIGHLRVTADAFLRRELTSRITSLAERYAPSTHWYIITMNKVFELGGESVPPEVVNNLLRLLAEGSGDNEQEDEQMRVYAVQVYLDAFKDASSAGLSDLVVQIASWVFGEYAYLIQDRVPLQTVVSRLAEIADRDLTKEETRGWVLNAIRKLVAQIGFCPAETMAVVERCSTSKNVDIQQRCNELKALILNLESMRRALPVDASCEDVRIDPALHFLDGFVQHSLANGARPYVSPSVRHCHENTGFAIPEVGLLAGHASVSTSAPALRFEAYAQPSRPGAGASTSNTPPRPGAVPSFMASASFVPGGSAPAAATGMSVLDAVPCKWGFEGYQKTASFAPSPTPSFSPNTGQHHGLSTQSFVAAPAVIERRDSVDSQGGNYGSSVAAPPRQMTEREKMAAALFAGAASPAASSGTAPMFHRSVAPYQSSQSIGNPATLQLAPQQPVTVVNDIFSMFSAPPANGSGNGDSSGSLFNGGIGAAPIAAITSSASLSFDSFVATCPTPAFVGTHVALGGEQASSLLPSLFAGVGCELTSYSLRSELEPHPKSHEVAQPLGEIANICLKYYKVWKPNETVVVIFVTNTSQGLLTNVVLDFQVPFSYCARYGGDPVPQVQGNRICLASVTPGCAVPVTVTLTVQSITMQSPADSALVVSVGNMGGSLFPIGLRIVDIVRSLTITTAEYASKWKILREEKKVRVSPTAVSLPKAFMDLARVKFGMYGVEVIEKEAILSGQTVDGRLILMHTVVNQGTLDITVRCQDRLLVEFIARAAPAAFS